MKRREAFDEFAVSLVGMEVAHVWRGHGSAVFFEIGNLAKRFRHDGSEGHPEGQVSLGIEWSWRVENEASIVCGSWGNEELWLPILSKFLNQPIRNVALFGRLPEVEFDVECLRILSFSTVEGQPQWHLVDRRHSPERWFTVRNGHLHVGDGTEPAV